MSLIQSDNLTILKIQTIILMMVTLLFPVHSLHALDAGTEADIVLNHNEILTANDIVEVVSPEVVELVDVELIEAEVEVAAPQVEVEVVIENNPSQELEQPEPIQEPIPEVDKGNELKEEQQVQELSFKEKIKLNNQNNWEVKAKPVDEWVEVLQDLVVERQDDQEVQEDEKDQENIVENEEEYFPLLIPTKEQTEEQPWLPEPLEEKGNQQEDLDENSFWNIEPLELPLVDQQETQDDEHEESLVDPEIWTWDSEWLSWDVLSGDVENDDIPKPLTIEPSPTRIAYDTNWLPLLETVNGVRVEWGMPYCSMMTRLNLQQFYPQKREVAGLWSSTYISRWDAIALIDYGITYGDLTNVNDRFLESVLENTSAVAHDLYIYKSSRIVEQAENAWASMSSVYKSYILQWHRVLVFKASDENWYILDTLRGTKSIKPQLLSTYIAHPHNAGREYYLHTDIVYDVIAEMTQDEEIRNLIELKKMKLFWALQVEPESFICEEKNIELIIPDSLPFDDEYMMNFERVVAGGS